MGKHAIKDDDVMSDVSTEPENASEDERATKSRKSKGKKRVSEIHSNDVAVPLNDIQNGGEDTESDDEDNFRPVGRGKLLGRSSTIDLNDDKSEKRKRRKSMKQSVSFVKPLDASEKEAARKARGADGSAVDLEREGTPEPGPNTSGPKTPKISALARANQLTSVAQTPIPAVQVDILSSKYEEWMKLATDNKINANNAWNFALIDYFQDMSLLRNELDNSINFQKASFTLDGCVKIWTSRVDSVGTETGKLLSNLADEIRGAERGDDEEGRGDGEDDEGKAKKTKAHRSETTLARNHEQLQVKKLDLEFSVDPLFKKTSADFDEGGAMGLLMNHLGVDEHIRVVFDASDSKLEDEDEKADQLESTAVDLSELFAKFLPSVDEVQTKTLSESLDDFSFGKDGNVDLTFDMFNRPMPEATDDAASDGGFNDVPMDTGPDGDSIIDGGEAAPPEDFFTGDQAVEENYDYTANNAEYDEGEGAPRPGALGPMENFDPRRLPSERDLVLAMTEDGEEMLDYFDTTVMKNWAGPQHWKLRRVAKKADPNAEGQPTVRTRKEKVAFEIDFSTTSRPSSKELFAPGTASSLSLPSGAGALVLSTSHKRKTKKSTAKRDDHLLPDDMHFSSIQLLRLFRKPKFTLKMRRHGVSGMPGNGEVGEGEIDEHFWANAAAAHNEAPGDEEGDETNDIPFATQFLDDYDDSGGFEDVAEEGVEDELLNATQGQLKRTRPEFVNYAKKAKRVDVRKLKENIWKGLDIIVDHDNPDDQAEERSGLARPPPTDPEDARQFSNVITNLETSYPKEKMEEISTSFCFICLLHLANEQGLKIEVNPSEEAQQEATFAEDDDLESAARVGDLRGLKVYRDPNATRAA